MDQSHLLALQDLSSFILLLWNACSSLHYALRLRRWPTPCICAGCAYFRVLGGCFLQGVRLLLIDESPADCCESLVTHQRSLRGGSSPDRASSSCSTDVGVGLLAPPFSNNSSRYGELGESSRSPMKSSVRLPWHSSTCHGHHFITGLLQLGTAMC